MQRRVLHQLGGPSRGWSFPCDFGELAHAFLWENGGPAIDLNAFVPSSSDLVLVEAVSINDRGEIVALGVLPSGDTRAVLLIPGGQDDTAANGPAAASRNATRARLAPEKLVALRARLSHWYRGFATIPRRVN